MSYCINVFSGKDKNKDRDQPKPSTSGQKPSTTLSRSLTCQQSEARNQTSEPVAEPRWRSGKGQAPAPSTSGSQQQSGRREEGRRDRSRAERGGRHHTPAQDRLGQTHDAHQAIEKRRNQRNPQDGKRPNYPNL